MKARRQRDIASTQAKIGMRVVGLDRPWDEVPVLFQNFVIENVDQLDILRQHCHTVTVEEAVGHMPPAEPAGTPASEPPAKPAFTELKPLAEELSNARRQYARANLYMDDLLGKISRDEPFSLAGARDIVRNCISSIANNANAMFWLTRIRHQDAYTAEHCVRVGILAITFGRYLGLSELELETIGLCGMLHDVGKMRIPPAVLNKPGALDPEEWRIMRQHSHFGFELLGSEHQLEPEIREAALSHHERLDGRGYPQGLAAAGISRSTRMITIVDAYDAMTSDRAYRRGIPSAEAISVLYRNRGAQFDEVLVEAFIRMIGVYPPGSLVELSSGEVAIVLATSPCQKLQPLVELVLDSHGHPCECRVLNLSQGPLMADGQPYAISRALPDGVEGFSLAEHIRHQAALASAGVSPPEPR